MVTASTVHLLNVDFAAITRTVAASSALNVDVDVDVDVEYRSDPSLVPGRGPGEVGPGPCDWDISIQFNNIIY